MTPQLLHLLTLVCTLIAVPATSALIGTTLSRILAQDGFPKLVNALIAYVVLLLMAAASAYTTNKLTGGLSDVLDVIGAAASLLLSGALVSLKPYLLYLNFLQSNVFPIVKAELAQDAEVTLKRPVVAANKTTNAVWTQNRAQTWQRYPDASTTTVPAAQDNQPG